jgi:hypothetical protein
VVVQAKGYRKSTPVSVAISETGETPIRILLQPEASGQGRTLQLPDGTPAAGARVAIIDPGGALVFTGAADQQGVIQIPDRPPGASLLAAHPRAGAIALPWNETQYDAETPIRLAPLAPPLSVRAVDSAGSPAGSASVFIWVGPVRIGGAALAFLTGTPAATTAWGTWDAAGLPAAPVRILVTRAPEAAVMSGAYDALATTIAFPWSGVAETKINN